MHQGDERTRMARNGEDLTWVTDDELEKFRLKFSRCANCDKALLTRTVVKYFVISLKIKSVMKDFSFLHFRMQRLR